MKKMWPRLLLCAAVWVSGVAPMAYGQGTAGTANADIVKMIQAGLPESTVVAKIREGAGRWDTSVDALIELKKIGATDAELGAITAVPLTTAAPLEQVENTPVELFGGTLLRTRVGDPYLRFQSAKQGIFPNGLESNTAYLVLYKGELGVLIPSVRLAPDCMTFNAIFLRNRVAVDRYSQGGCMGGAGDVGWKLKKTGDGTDEFEKDRLIIDPDKKFGTFSSIAELHDSGLHYKAMRFVDGKKQIMNDQVLFGQFPFNFTKEDDTGMHSLLLDLLVDQLMANFDQTVKKIEDASGLTDPTSQLSKAARYQPISLDQARQFAAILSQRCQEQASKAHSSGGGGWLSAMNAMQGISNVQSAMKSGSVASANHDVAGQFNAIANASKAEFQTINALSDPNAAHIAPVAPSAKSQEMANSAKLPTVSGVTKPNGFTYSISNGQQKSANPHSNNLSSSPQPKASPNPGGVPNGVSTGTVTLANCVAVNVEGPCIPLFQYHPTTQQATGTGICPASGFVPGVMIRQESDVAVAVPCKPGTPYGPLIATTSNDGYTGVTAPDPAAAGGGGVSGTGAGGSSTAGAPFPNLNNCIGSVYHADPITGTHLVLTNNCSVAAQVYFYASPQANGGVTLSPGQSDNTYDSQTAIAAAGGVSIYACPAGEVPRKPDGSLAYTGVNNQFGCFQK